MWTSYCSGYQRTRDGTLPNAAFLGASENAERCDMIQVERHSFGLGLFRSRSDMDAPKGSSTSEGERKRGKQRRGMRANVDVLQRRGKWPQVVGRSAQGRTNIHRQSVLQRKFGRKSFRCGRQYCSGYHRIRDGTLPNAVFFF